MDLKEGGRGSPVQLKHKGKDISATQNLKNVQSEAQCREIEMMLRSGGVKLDLKARSLPHPVPSFPPGPPAFV
jgi:hypothetical protein